MHKNEIQRTNLSVLLTFEFIYLYRKKKNKHVRTKKKGERREIWEPILNRYEDVNGYDEGEVWGRKFEEDEVWIYTK
jgi:hypothetical protein